MREPVPNTSSFPTSRCEPCGKVVLTYVALGDDGEETRRCAHCDGAIAGELSWISADELEAQGYEIGYRPREEGGGCGNGCGGGCSVKRN